MKLSRLGDYIELVDSRNVDLLYSEKDVRGISTAKLFIKTKANLNNVNLANYKIVKINEFAYVADTSRRGEKIGLAYSDTEPCIISSIYTTFKVKDENQLMSKYLMMYFKRPEFDRYARFNSWGSARETFSWEDFCDIELVIPPIEIQKKYVDVYESLLHNLKVYESKLEDLKLVCDGYIEKLRITNELVRIGDVVDQYKDINKENKFKRLAGLIGGDILEARKSSGQENLTKFQVVYPNSIVYPPPHFGEIGTIGIVKNEPVLLSPMYVTFKAKDERFLNMEYLLLWCRRKEFVRYAFFASCSSVRDTFDFDLLAEYRIPIPHIDVQNCIVNVFKCMNKRKMCVKKLKKYIQNICPILIKGSIEECK